MSFVVMLFALVLGIMIEQAAPASAYIGFAKPPVLISVVAYYALNPWPNSGRPPADSGRHPAALMLSAAFIGGILNDSLGALPLGISSLAFAALGGILHHYREEVFSGKLVTNIVFGAVLGLIMPLVINTALVLLGQTPYSAQLCPLILKIIFSTVMGAVLFPIIYFFLERLELLTGAGGWDNRQSASGGRQWRRKF